MDDVGFCLYGRDWRAWHSTAAVVPKTDSATVFLFVDYLPLVVQCRVGHFDAAIDFRVVFDHPFILYGVLFRYQCC